jgi:APA family basic amino acid/polyamine antiporter
VDGSARTLEVAREFRPAASLSARDGVAMVVGIVIGAAIFQTPALVAGSLGTPSLILLAWVAGAVISLLGGLCYAELGSTYPHPGGDYVYLTRAYGVPAGFLFAWARVAVIQTGSIAMIAFVFGDYATQIVSLGSYSPALYAAAAVLAMTVLNIVGVRRTATGQTWLSVVQILGIGLLVVAGWLAGPAAPVAAAPSSTPTAAGVGLAMVFVLLTYGGWNEAAFISGELRDPRRNMVRVMVLSIGLIAGVYLLVNVTLLATLGAARMAKSEAVAAELMREVMGDRGAVAIAMIVSLCALASINAMIFTGARTGFALGRDFSVFRPLGAWDANRRIPSTAVLVVGAVALALVGFGAAQRRGFEAMVEFTAPVFWGFVLLTAMSLFVLRRRDRGREDGFRVPAYPLVPLVFVAVCGWLLYSSVAYTGFGALVGLGVVAVGLPLLWIERRKSERARERESERARASVREA